MKLEQLHKLLRHFLADPAHGDLMPLTILLLTSAAAAKTQLELDEITALIRRTRLQ